ncbi:MAG: hypothetical protein ACRCT2_13870 [Plesiomonas shigelloides]
MTTVTITRYVDWDASTVYIATAEGGHFDKGRSVESAIGNLRLTDPLLGAIELILL